MSDHFARSLLFEGRLLVGAATAWNVVADDHQALQEAAIAGARQLAGPPIQTSNEVLTRAVHVVYRFGRRYLHPELSPPDKDISLQMPSPKSPADHLAGDIAFRFLAGLHRRIRGREGDDPLGVAARELLRQWPLSGVLADIAEPPMTPIDFGHPGLAMLYAERLALHERAGWHPQNRDHLEVVGQAMGMSFQPVEFLETSE